MNCLESRKAVIRHSIVYLVILGLLLPPMTMSAQSTDDRVERILSGMSVEQRVGQVFMVDFPGPEVKPDSAITHLIREYHVGGVYLTWLNGNVTNEPGTPTQVAKLTNSLQQLACEDTRQPDVADCIPLFVAMDHEGDGYPRTHLRRDATAVPSAMAIGATWKPDDAQSVGEVVGRELAAVGVNMLLGPVVDVLDRPRPEGRGDLNLRVFGSDPTWVGAMGRAYIRGVHRGSQGRVLTTAKHFPGHGSSDRNPDEEVSTVSKSLEDLERSDLVPFFVVTQAATDGGMTDALMPSHIRYRGFQGDVSQLTKPISLDPEGMKAFMSLPALAAWRREGLVVADALGVRALQTYYDPTLATFPARQIAKDALLAGNDLLPIVLYSLDRKYENQLANMQFTISYFHEEYRANPAFRERVDDAVRHILRAKLKLYPDLSLQSAQVNVEQVGTVVGKSDAAIRAMMQDALTILRPDGGRRLPSPPRSSDNILILGCFYGCLPGATMGETAIQDTIVQLYGPAGSGQIDPARVHTIQFNQLDALMANELPTLESASLRKTIEEADWIVLGIVAYLPDAVSASAAFKRFLRDPSFDLRSKKIVAVAYNAPYYLDATEIGKLTAYLVVYSKAPPAIETSVRALFGELPSRGAPPVSVPGVDYDLATQLQPDPSQRIALSVPSATTWRTGDSLTVQAGPLLDRNGHLVRDGTPVDLSARYSELGVALAPQPVTPTQNGLASAVFKLTLAGSLEITAQSGDARSEPARLVVVPPASAAPATAPPSPTPPAPAGGIEGGREGGSVPWSGLIIAVALLLGGALLARAMIRRSAPVPPMDVTARGGPSVEQAPGISLSPVERVILRNVFTKYSRITVDAEFRSGYSGAHTLLVLPLKPDGRADAYAIAKLAPQWLIRQELANYETFVKDTLPPVTARIEDTPTLPEGESLGALRYTFVGQLGPARTQSLREFASTHTAGEVADVIEHKLFEVFGRNWWMQRRPYSFRLGQEYERLLPVNFMAEISAARPDVTLVAGAREWPDTRALAVGQVVRLEGFVVEEVGADGRTVTLTLPDAASHRFRARVRCAADAPPRSWPFEAGAMQGSPPITGTILTTRTLLLEAEARKAFADIRASDESVVLGLQRYPNPLRACVGLLDERVFGTLATIHGDLNLENILIDPGGYVWLIDFALTRDGHTLYDFARLETELVTRHVAPLMAQAGLGALEFVRVMEWLDRGEWSASPALGHVALDDAARLLASVRRVVNRCLFDPSRPDEYTRALMICQLGALKFDNLDHVSEAPLPKQLAFVSAAYLCKLS